MAVAISRLHGATEIGGAKMFEHQRDSINRSFRHQQSEQLSHALEPCEFPIQKSRPRRSIGSGLANSPQPVPPKTRTRKPGKPSSSLPPRSISNARPIATDEMGCYLADALDTPLLTREQEHHLAKQIFRYRRAFQRLILKEPAVIQYVVGLLSQWESNQLRLDAICNLGLSELDKRKTLEPKIRLNLKTLKRLPKLIRSATTADETKRIHQQAIRLVEDLMIRPQTMELAPFENDKASELLAKYRSLCQYLTQANMRLVVQVARRICGHSPVLLDMVQEGNRGLMHAVTKFDHRCQVRFSTYATPWIKQAVFGALTNFQRNIRIPENFRAVSRTVNRRVNDIRNANFEFRNTDSGRTISLIADEMNMPPTEVEKHLCIQRDTCSLDQPVAGSSVGTQSNSNLADVLPDHRRTDPLKIAQGHEREQFVRSIMKQTLTRREHDVISLRFGIKDGQDRSFAEVGRVMGLTRQRVCQVEKQALKKLEKMTERLDYSCV